MIVCNRRYSLIYTGLCKKGSEWCHDIPTDSISTPLKDLNSVYVIAKFLFFSVSGKLEKIAKSKKQAIANFTK